jgi:fibronectin-binding autotransporter adhesin
MKQIKYTLCLSILCISLTFQSHAANRFWVASAGSNWNNTANWSNVSGGAGGFSVPVAGDLVSFDGAGLGNCTIDIAVSVQTLTVNATYTGTISQGANTISTTGAATFAGGTFTGGSVNISVTGTFTLSGTAFTSTTATLILKNNSAFTGGSFIHNNGSVQYNQSGAITVSGTGPTFYNLEFIGEGFGVNITATAITVANTLTISGASLLNLNTGTINADGDIVVTNSATGGGGTGLIDIVGTVNQNYTGSAAAGEGALPQLTINKASGTLNLANYPSVANNFTYTAGIIAAGTSTFCFTRAGVNPYTITGSVTLNSVDFIASANFTATIAAGTTLTCAADLTLSGSANINLNTGTINVGGNLNLTNTGAAGGGSATINLDGSSTQNIDGSAITGNESLLPIVTINSTGTVSLLGNISFANNLTYNSGAINPGTSTCYIVNTLTVTGTFPIYNLEINRGANCFLTIAAGSTLTATNNLDMENGAFNITINTGTLAVQNNIIDNNTGLAGGGTATILINGTASQNISSPGLSYEGSFPAITINKVSGTLTFPSLITVRGNWTYTAGTLDVSTNSSTVVFAATLTISGSHTLNTIDFDAAGNYTYTVNAGTTLSLNGDMDMSNSNNITLTGGNINLNGNLNLTNTGIGGGGTTVLSFIGAANQSITGVLAIDQSRLPSVTINKTGGTLTFSSLITVRGNWTYTAGTIDVNTNNTTVIFRNTLIITGTHTLNNVNFAAKANYVTTISSGTVLTVSGTLTISDISNETINAPIAGTQVLQAQGNISVTNTGLGGGGTGGILINGAGAQSFSSTSPAGEGRMPYITIQKPSGTLTLSGIISESRDWTYSSGTVDASTNTTTVAFGGNNLNINSAGMSFYNVTVLANTSALASSVTVNNNLTISAGTLSPGVNTVNLAGNWSDWGAAGFVKGTSIVNFDGSSLQTITNPGAENFYSLASNNSGTGIQLENNTTVGGTLTMTQGNIDLNTNTLTLGTSAAAANIGTMAYTAGTIINSGTFTRWFAKVTIPDGSVAGLFPVGNINNFQPFYISAPVAPTTGGTVTLTYTYVSGNTLVSFPDGASTVEVIKNLNWALLTGNGLAGGTYNIDAQGTGLGTIGNVADLRLTLVGSAIGTAGINAGTIADPQVNTTGLTLANLTNSFYIGSVNYANSDLPLTLLSFTAFLSNAEVQLNWTTPPEINNVYFTIQRSNDEQRWENLEQVASDSTSSTTLSYTVVDKHPFPGSTFYRLMLEDKAGNETYSAIRTVILGNLVSAITIYPNPANDHFIITFPTAGTYEISLLSSLGQNMNSIIVRNGNSTELNVSNVKSGIYFIRIDHGDQTETKKVVIN